ncbi:hypothetical protein TDB9533_04355 [Thalassocella blandensis]|nr:hypothetical protein TDB9533_04355 [Thalassocella blandensis]
MEQDAAINTTELPTASVLKRMLALGYDLFILVAISMAYSAIATIIMALAMHIDAKDYLPMQKGPWFLIGWVLTIVIFYWFFWHRAGQTVGMKTWRIKLISQKHAATHVGVTHLQCFIRILTGPFSLVFFGIGYMWQWIDKEKLTLHDRLSNTRVVQLPTPENKKKKKKGKQKAK